MNAEKLTPEMKRCLTALHLHLHEDMVNAVRDRVTEFGKHKEAEGYERGKLITVPCLTAIEALLGHTLEKMCAEYRKPNIGDWVMEYSNPFVPLIKRFGKLIEEQKGENNYSDKFLIEHIDGSSTWWSNCKLYVIPRMEPAPPKQGKEGEA